MTRSLINSGGKRQSEPPSCPLRSAGLFTVSNTLHVTETHLLTSCDSKDVCVCGGEGDVSAFEALAIRSLLVFSSPHVWRKRPANPTLPPRAER